MLVNCVPYTETVRQREKAREREREREKETELYSMRS